MRKQSITLLVLAVLLTGCQYLTPSSTDAAVSVNVTEGCWLVSEYPDGYGVTAPDVTVTNETNAEGESVICVREKVVSPVEPKAVE